MSAKATEIHTAPKGWMIVASAAALLLGVGAAVLLVMHKSEPPRDQRGDVGPLVEAVVVHREDVDVTVRGNGTVEPRVAVDVVPQVSGKVIEVHEELTEGGQVPAEAVLVRIDPADYQLALERAAAALAQARGGVRTAEAAVARARTALEVEQAEADVAIEEWRAERGEAPPPALLARRPQIRQREAELASAQAELASAQAAVRSAQAQVSEAELGLERTAISVPFAGRVMSESVDVGQFVTSGQTLARVYSTDVARIVVPFQDRQLQWFAIPSPVLDLTPSPGRAELESDVNVTVSAAFAGKRRQWSGRVARTAGQVDRQSRMVDVVIEVDDPFDAANPVPLMPGMFVEVAIAGHRLEDVVRVPRFALRADRRVWVAREGKLNIVDVDVVRTDRQHAYVAGGLEDGDVVITSQLDVVIEGMAVRVPEDMLDRGPRTAASDAAVGENVTAQ